MTAFTIVWAGQLLSLLGSATSAFALAVWLYGSTGAIADLSLIAIAVYVPQIVLSPWGGILADRRDRRRLMLAADIGAAATTLVLLACARAGELTPPLAILLVALGSSCNALQWPAFESATVSLVPAAQLGRASGMLELSRGASQLAAPVLGGALLGATGLDGILVLDAISFACALAALAVVRIPSHPGTTDRTRHLAHAWRLVAAIPGLVAMLVLFAATSFTFAVTDVALKGIVLATGEPWQLGIVLSTAGIGMVAGSIAMTAWGGPRRRIIAILAFQLVEGGSLVLAGTHPTFGVLCVAAFVYGAVIPLTFGCARTIWQLAIPAAAQGRAAALRNVALTISIPLGYAVAPSLARLMALPSLVIAMGGVTWLAAFGTYAYRPYRDLDAACFNGHQ